MRAHVAFIADKLLFIIFLNIRPSWDEPIAATSRNRCGKTSNRQFCRFYALSGIHTHTHALQHSLKHPYAFHQATAEPFSTQSSAYPVKVFSINNIQPTTFSSSFRLSLSLSSSPTHWFLSFTLLCFEEHRLCVRLSRCSCRRSLILLFNGRKDG